MKIYISLLLCCIFSYTYSQTTPEKDKAPTEITPATEVEAIFPGGPEMFRKYVNNNIVLPEIEEGVSGEIIMSYTVGIDGLLTDIKLLKNTLGKTGKEIASEIIRVLKLSPKWIPASINNKPVKSSYRFPIKISKNY